MNAQTRAKADTILIVEKHTGAGMNDNNHIKGPMLSAVIVRSPYCPASRETNLLRSFKSQPSLRESACTIISFIPGCHYARQITPQRCERVHKSTELSSPHATIPVSSSLVATDEKVVVELAERARILIDRESLMPLMYKSLNPDELKCREKMMDWCLKVLDIGTSKDVSAKVGIKQGTSIESIYIASIAFSYVDQSTAIHAKLKKCRKMYKLLCLVCVHLAAKMHGLFNRPTHESMKEGTPSLHTILSFRGLSVLSQGEFSETEMSQMELIVLQSLNWNLRTSIHDVFEWIDILSLVATADGDTIRERAFHYVWTAVNSHRLLRFTSSQLAIGIFKCSMRQQNALFGIEPVLDIIDLPNHVDEVSSIENEVQAEAQISLTMLSRSIG